MTRVKVINFYRAWYRGTGQYIEHGAPVLVAETVTTFDSSVKGRGAPPEREAAVEVLIGANGDAPWYSIPRMTDLADVTYLGSQGKALDY